MLTLINTNRMKPPIAPVGLDYLATAARAAGIETEIVDLCLANDPGRTLTDYFDRHAPELVGISFRNVDDCFWPGAGWFVPELEATVATVRDRCEAPTVLGGVGFSIFAEDLLRRVGADFGVRGDGEAALGALLRAIRRQAHWEEVPGLVRRAHGTIRANAPAWPETIEFVRAIGPDCAGAAVGIRLYPGTPLVGRMAAECPLDRHPGVHRGYEGPVDLLRPTFYVSPALGERPAALIRDLIAGDPRFFAPTDTTSPLAVSSQYNYSEHPVLIEAIAAGARGAYWDILRRLPQARPLSGRGAG